MNNLETNRLKEDLKATVTELSDTYEELSLLYYRLSEEFSGLSSFKEVIECIRYHHEHYDGTGIHGLCGEEIPLMARILAVADAFDAMMSDRPYRKKKSIDETVREIITCAGKQFDPNVVQACILLVKSTHKIILPEPESYI